MFRKALLACLLMVAGSAIADFPRAELTAGFHRIEAEVVANPADRAQGLMNRRHLAPNQGMIFVFPASAVHCFWMKNTPLPLSIAFLDEKGVMTIEHELLDSLIFDGLLALQREREAA